ncbi:MAG: hypothetical protein KatS3mg048_0942 [Caldilinea sp.]|jgi:hypothetical protein|nr:MAG: hypothetical protein KatS3mg048_0942 [Caldilinea sp.]
MIHRATGGAKTSGFVEGYRAFDEAPLFQEAQSLLEEGGE